MDNNISPECGLTKEQVETRIKEGKVNIQPRSKTKTIGQIIQKNSLTLFNLLNIVLALMVIFVGSFQNLLFINIVIINTIIGIVQEVRAKITIDSLSLISQPRARVVRDREEITLAFEKIVIDDVIRLKAGDQIPSDAKLLSGKLEVNEALLTGESKSIIKQSDDQVLSGSFVVSGAAQAQVIAVGDDNYSSLLITGVKAVKEPNSQIMAALKLIVKIVGIVIVPIGFLLLYTQIFLQDTGTQTAVVSTVAALIGMIPQGLVLLTSVALAISVIRLGRHQTLVQELYCIEALARVDVLCLDKTGTITEGNMEVLSFECLSSVKNSVPAMRALVHHVNDDNPTAKALRFCFKGEPPKWECQQVVHFSSERRYSGAYFAEEGSYIIGAPEALLASDNKEIKDKVESYAREGRRVLVLGHSPDPFGADNALPGKIEILGLMPIGDKIRKEVKKTFDFFRNQGVKIKIISGDHPITVANVAKRAGLWEWNNYIDVSSLGNDDKIKEAALKYSVFGRVNPQQKKVIIKTLKKAGHTVAMTGDGVNDLLALREADCSIAMAEGSDAVRQIAQLVFLGSDFSNFKRVLMEGRRVINNISRVAALLLVKIIFSVLLAIILIVSSEAYPFVPIQLTLIFALTIGIPSVFFALEGNKNRVTGDFLEKILKKALPGALTIVFNVIVILIIGDLLKLSYLEKSTIALISTGISGLVILWRVSQPLNNKRWLLFFAMSLTFAISVIFFGFFFYLLPLNQFTIGMVVLLTITILVIYPLGKFSSRGIDWLEELYREWKKKAKATG